MTRATWPEPLYRYRARRTMRVECSPPSMFYLVAGLCSWKLGRRIPFVEGRTGHALVPTPSGVDRSPRAVTLTGSKRYREGKAAADTIEHAGAQPAASAGAIGRLSSRVS
jgi:hypothetical protein